MYTKFWIDRNSLGWSKWHQRAPKNFRLIENILGWSKWHQRALEILDWSKIF